MFESAILFWINWGELVISIILNLLGALMICIHLIIFIL